MDLTKLNGQFANVFEDIANIKDYRFVDKKSVVGNVYTIKSVYVVNGKYGLQSVFVCEKGNEKIRLSFNGDNYYKTITADGEIIDAIRNGNMTIKVVMYHNKKYNKDCFKAQFDCIPF